MTIIDSKKQLFQLFKIFPAIMLYFYYDISRRLTVELLEDYAVSSKTDKLRWVIPEYITSETLAYKILEQEAKTNIPLPEEMFRELNNPEEWRPFHLKDDFLKSKLIKQ